MCKASLSVSVENGTGKIIFKSSGLWVTLGRNIFKKMTFYKKDALRLYESNAPILTPRSLICVRKQPILFFGFFGKFALQVVGGIFPGSGYSGLAVLGPSGGLAVSN